MKNPKGEKYNCESCKKNEVMTTVQNVNKIPSKPPKINSNDTNSKQEYTLNDIMEKLMDMDNKYTDLLNKYEEQIKVNEILKAEILTIKSQLGKEQNKNEQNELRNNIIVNGVPYDKRENIEDIIKKMGEALQVQTVNKLKCFRIGKGRNHNGQMPIKVCFTSENEKEEFLEARKKKMINAKDLGYEEENIIYLNHDLTKANQYLFKEVLKYKRENNYRFAWISRGKIYMRKDEHSPVQPIEDTSNLKN